jgi:hypothetical protein
MIPVIGTSFGMIEEGIVSSVMVGDDASPRFELVATLMGKSAIFALVSVQEAGCVTPVTGGPFSSF